MLSLNIQFSYFIYVQQNRDKKTDDDFRVDKRLILDISDYWNCMYKDDFYTHSEICKHLLAVKISVKFNEFKERIKIEDVDFSDVYHEVSLSIIIEYVLVLVDIW